MIKIRGDKAALKRIIAAIYAFGDCPQDIDGKNTFGEVCNHPCCLYRKTRPSAKCCECIEHNLEAEID